MAREDGHIPRLQRLQRLHEVDGAASPSGQFGDQDGIDLASLRERHHLLALDTVGLGTGGFLLVNADDLEAATLGEGT